MSKTKLRRLTDEEQENISAFKEAVKNEIEKSNPFNGFSFEKNHTKNNYKINAIIDYGDFKAIIFYNPCFIISDIIDVEFDLGAKYKYNIYSIFNFFEIDDYTQYYFSDVLENTTFEECVHFIFEMINKYSFEIKKACEPINLSRLEELVLQDYKNEYKKKSDDEISKIRLDEFSIDVVHPFFSDASDSGNTQKLLNKLEKKNEKGKLETLYEKRLLKFLQSGNEIQNELTVKNNKNRKAYIKLMAKVFGLEVIIPIILAVGSVVYNLCYLYSGAYLLG
ncbi:MAG: hypothetical protein LIO62_03420, partial [Clostridiales bacterium]|nr:hypothetical protein [Clostridiales bacterium]